MSQSRRSANQRIEPPEGKEVRLLGIPHPTTPRLQHSIPPLHGPLCLDFAPKEGAQPARWGERGAAVQRRDKSNSAAGRLWWLHQSISGPLPRIPSVPRLTESDGSGRLTEGREGNEEEKRKPPIL